MPFKPIATQSKGESEKKKKRGLFARAKKEAVEEEVVTLEEERAYRSGTVSIRDLIAPSAFRVESNLVQLGDTFLRTVYVITYPRYISVGWSSPILNLNLTLCLSC